MLYRQPRIGQNGEGSSPFGSHEAAEWERLNQIKTSLSGQSYTQSLRYYTPDPLDPSKRFTCAVGNQLDYYQEGGSCAIFSIKSLVSSIVGRELTTLHNDFMQQNSANGHIESIRQKIAAVDDQINKLNNLQLTVPTNEINSLLTGFEFYMRKPLLGISTRTAPNAAFTIVTFSDPQLKQQWQIFNSKRQTPFFNTPALGLEKLRQSKKRQYGNLIQNATMANDLNELKPQVLVLTCSNPDDAQKLAGKIEELTTSNPPVSINENNENQIILGHDRCVVLFNKLGLNAQEMFNQLPQQSNRNQLGF